MQGKIKRTNAGDLRIRIKVLVRHAWLSYGDAGISNHTPVVSARYS
jgi:hypothetical protein